MKAPFDYHRPTDAQIVTIAELRKECKVLYELIQAKLPNSRERAVAITKLEEVSMWVNKAVISTGEGPIIDDVEEARKRIAEYVADTRSVEQVMDDFLGDKSPN